MTIEEIMAILPHRYPFLLIDRVLSITMGEELVALKNVSVNEPFFQGHFPGHPVMPGVLILEAMAQAAAILAYRSQGLSPKDSIFYLASIGEVKYKQMVLPGDQLIVKVKLAGRKHHFWKIEGVVTVDDKVVCTANILSAQRDLTP